MSDDLDAIQAIFFEECAEGLVAAEAGLSQLAAGSRDPEVIAAVFRAVHSIKGGSGAFGHEALLGFSHRFENVLDALRAGRLAPTEPLLQLLLQSSDMLADHVAAARAGAPAPADEAVAAQLDAWMIADPPAPIDTAPAVATQEDEFGFAPIAVSFEDFDAPALPAADPTTAWSIRFRPSSAALANGGEALLLLREVERLGGEVLSCDCTALPPLGEMDPEGAYLLWTLSAPGELAEDELRDCFDFVAPDSLIEIERAVERAPEPTPVEPVAMVPQDPTPPPSPPPFVERRQSDRGESIRVDLAKLDGLLNLVGELVIRNSILADRLGPTEQDRVELPQLSRLTRSIQDMVMSLRAQPIQQAFNRVPRILRELESETGKKVLLEVSGEATEVDKRVVERISDPLTHMIRNAVDHGIEPVEQRLAAGKPAAGTIRLSAQQRGGRIILRVEDDGGGINREAVRARAIERGLIAADAILSDEEIDQLICAPGFSTAATISNISGRGVGMDVVRSNIEGLGGRVEIASEPGVGTSFTLVLPLTLAILDGMVVRLGGQRFVLPLQSVVESVRPEPGQVSALTPDSEVIELRGSYLPLRRLAEFFGIRGAEEKPENGLVIVVEDGSAGQVGLFVDTVDDRREVVIKSLDQNLHPIRGLGGATVLGDGSIALILDVDAIIGTAPAVRQPRELAA
ncbi:chemotaxis protein CheA [Sphingomonas sp. LHG3443-2]|uniref:chemotaxis protein CheA n=1 Tax=Sphingomonas sp. LHG3443-2 TaxID=2804639 RepID=UPI003CF2F93E